MCGIAGVIDLNTGPLNDNIGAALKTLTACLQHRGSIPQVLRYSDEVNPKLTPRQFIKFESRGYLLASHNDSEIIGLYIGERTSGG